MTESLEDIAQGIANDYGLLSGMREHIKQELRRDIADALRAYADSRLEEAATKLEEADYPHDYWAITWAAEFIRTLKSNKETT